MERNGEAKSVCNIELMDILDYYDVPQDVIIIDYYDVPQLFVAKFKSSEAYLVCILKNIDEIKGCMFLGVKVTKARLNDFYHKEIDLRSIFTCPEFDQPFFEVTENGCEYVAEWIPEKTLSEEELPEKDYYYETKTTIEKKAKEFAGYNIPSSQDIATTAKMSGKYEGFKAGAEWMFKKMVEFGKTDF